MSAGESSLVATAAALAAASHAGQTRKYTSASYIEHPAAVAQIVSTVPHTDEMLAAAWLHDTIEDCGVTVQQIEHHCGIVVAAFVEWLTDVSKPSDGNRRVRKELDRQHIARAPAEVKTVKLADLLDNSSSILQHDADFAAVYLREKRLLLDVLREGDAILWDAADQFLTERGL